MKTIQEVLEMREQGILHRCKCIGRDFTDKEWTDYLRSHPNSGRESVYECNGFEFNISDVCLNPEERKFFHGNMLYLVELAEKTPGRFVAGYDLQSRNGQFCCIRPCSFDDDGYATKDKAVAAMFIAMREDRHADKSFCERMIFEHTCKQLTLDI